MQTEGFLRRWSRLKGAAENGAPADADAALPTPVPAPATVTAAVPAQPAPAVRLPTLHDVALLGADSDYSAFVAKGVDQAVRRGALKKLFADPHFNLIDGLDIFMNDYNKPDPVSAAMLGALQHAQSFFAQAAALEPKEEGDADSASGDARAEGAPGESSGAAA